jgi:hypothetical protein
MTQKQLKAGILKPQEALKIVTFEGNISNKFDDIDRSLSDKHTFVFIQTKDLISIDALQTVLPKLQTGKCAIMLEITPQTSLKTQFPLILEILKVLQNHQKPFFMLKMSIPLTNKGFEAFQIFLRIFTEHPICRFRTLYLTFIGKEGEMTKNDFYSLVNRYSSVIHVDMYKTTLVYSRLKQLFLKK